jgi:hypothetical protein
MSSISGGGGGGGALTHPGYVPQNWYFPMPGWLNQATTGTPVVGTTYLTPMYLPTACHVKALGGRITTAGTTTCAFGLYGNNNGATPAVNRPGLLIDNTAALADITANATVTGPLTASRPLSPGWYWLGIQLGDVTVRYSALTPAQTITSAILGSSVAANVHANTSTVTGVSFPGTYGTWPADATTQTITEITSLASLAPALIFQVDTVP